MTEKQKSRAEFSKKLYQALKNKNLEQMTYKKLGKLFNTSEMAVHKWINGKSMPTLARIPIIAKELNVSVEYLLSDGVFKELDHEQKLLAKYRNLSNKQQQLLQQILDAFIQ